MKVGNIMPRAGLETTSLAIRASVLPLHHIGSLMSSLCPCQVSMTSMQLLASEVGADYQGAGLVMTSILLVSH